MTIGEKIKMLRQKQGITQEKLADYLNISPQSVSKWENNNAFPDISLVVPLANYFGITIDELFDRDSDEQTADIEEYDKKYQRFANRGLVAESIALWREAVQKYPRNYHCLIHLAHSVWDTLQDGAFEAFHNENAKEVVRICERILADCTDNNIRNSALQLLVFTYSNQYLSFADESKAVKYANMAGGLYTCREMLLEHAYYYTDDGKKKMLEQKHQNNLYFMDKLCMNIYLQEYQSPEEEILACETAIKLWTLLVHDGNFLFYHCRMADVWYRLAKHHAKLQHRVETLDALKNAVEHAKCFDRRATDPASDKVNYSSVFVSRATDDPAGYSKNFKETHLQMLRQDMIRKCFDFVREEPDFVALQKDSV